MSKPTLEFASTARRVSWKVGHGADASDASMEEFGEDTWEAHARFDVLAEALRSRHESKPGKIKRWEYMAQSGGSTWNVRSVIDGREDNVWLWRSVE